MTRPSKEGLAWGAALAAALPAVVFPVFNPDLFWHLSAGRWIAAHHALPRADFLSSSMPGAPWLDFEWLSQVVYYLSYAAGGLWGVWGLKALLVLASVRSFGRLLVALSVPRVSRAGAAGVFSVCLIAYADARPDLFSLILLAWLLRRLELKSLGAAEAFLAFALWSNLHAGFALGLVALALYSCAAYFQEEPALARGRAACLAAGALGACVNPYGRGAYAVVWRHWSEQAELARSIKEWGPLGFSNPVYWPAWGLLGLLVVFGAHRLARRPKDVSWPLLGLAVYLSVATLEHERAVIFLALAGGAALATLAPDDERWAAAALASCWLFLGWLLPRVSWTGAFNPKFVPLGAAEFMDREKETLAPLRAYNEWVWGGYLGFRLPWFRVSSDGRYLFHAQHGEEARAAEAPASWEAHLDKRGFQAALVPNAGRRFPSRRRYPDGSTKEFARPWYLYFFPRESWALVYWDNQALLFVRRAAAPPEWLDEHEYLWRRPGDDDAFADALKRGEIPVDGAADEERRHLLEVTLK